MAQLDELIRSIQTDQTSGASELLPQVLTALALAAETGQTVGTAAAVCRAQPSMAPIWNAAIAAINATNGEPSLLERLHHRRHRALPAITRFAALLHEGVPHPLRVMTYSRSGTVEGVIRARHAEGRISVVMCSESRPALEGRRLATSLAGAGIPVELFSDGALSSALEQTDVVLVGADAVAADGFINKAGTRALAAAALHGGVPVYVLASTDKLVMPALAPYLTLREGPPEPLWAQPPAGVRVRNRAFERVPLDLMAAAITDIGVLGAGMVDDACRALESPSAHRALAELLRAL